MDCNEARPLLGAAHDRELSAAEALRVETHVAQCAECRRETQMLRAVSDATRAADYFRAPDALRARILAALPATTPAAQERSTDEAWQGQAGAQAVEPPARSRGRGLWDWARDAWRTPRGTPVKAGGRGPASALAWPAGIAVAAVALAVSVALVAPRPRSASATFVDELVASHVRAQLSGHDIDVVSSDQHTVKPWFNGRIDYAPPVEDLAAEGFALTGGRLDYIGHHRVAVLVYRYRKHIIDVYVMPQTAAGAREAPAGLASDGYALANWQDQGMLWWAVSDAEPAVLMRLRQALTARLSRPAQPNAG
ncbi:anti-sigma factor family protein [Trinickia diaoshuihuensis]|uniref:anti-sigma factor family protein n=1 Tax=Trinickia diaoshuihuensis TaxID=2292265 RepID=UPI000E25FC40|nr:zf-HC2 domain-containing protein [Trinickia diaoshuihuensis]